MRKRRLRVIMHTERGVSMLTRKDPRVRFRPYPAGTKGGPDRFDVQIVGRVEDPWTAHHFPNGKEMDVWFAANPNESARGNWRWGEIR